MPRRAIRLLDNRIEPTQKIIPSDNKRFAAVFLLFLSGNSTPTEEHKTIDAPNLPAAIKIARQMCLNPTLFPPGCVARIPDRNVTPLPQGAPIRKYQASFEVYRDGDRNRRPHIILKTIEADGIQDAIKKARTICRETPRLIRGNYSSDLVRCPAKNVKRIK